jgi:hypothetical protein
MAHVKKKASGKLHALPEALVLHIRNIFCM